MQITIYNDIVLVEDGTIRVVAEREATIYVNKSDISKNIDVVVTSIPLLSINISEKYVSLSLGENIVLI